MSAEAAKWRNLWPGDEDRTRDVLDAALSPLADSVWTEGGVGPVTGRSAALPVRSGLLARQPSQAQAFFVSQKISAISSIFASSSSALAASSSPLVPEAPASLVASLTRVCSCGYFSKCGGLK